MKASVCPNTTLSRIALPDRYNTDVPIHDWTRVSAGTFHDFHGAWIAELRRALNGGVLPDGYYAMAEQIAGQMIPDVLTLQEAGEGEINRGRGGNGGMGLAVNNAPPRVALSDTLSEAAVLATRQRRLVIYHTTGDRIIALLEIVSPGNKERRAAMESFVLKAVRIIEEGFHLVLIDLFPPGRFDPEGMHGAIWGRLGGTYEPPSGKPLTLASYVATAAVRYYVEPTAVGAELTEMPLFLDADHYVYIPLESTYQAAYEGVPRRWKRVIEGAPG